MKTTSYTTGNTMKAIVASLIILTSFSGIARAENSGKESIQAVTALQIATYSAKEFVKSEMTSETDYWMNNNTGTNNEAVEQIKSLQVEGYNAKEFVEAGLAVEAESWINGNEDFNNSVAEPELELQGTAYNAKDFVEAELAVETESWVNNFATCTGSEEGFNCGNKLASK